MTVASLLEQLEGTRWQLVKSELGAHVRLPKAIFVGAKRLAK